MTDTIRLPRTKTGLALVTDGLDGLWLEGDAGQRFIDTICAIEDEATPSGTAIDAAYCRAKHGGEHLGRPAGCGSYTAQALYDELAKMFKPQAPSASGVPEALAYTRPTVCLSFTPPVSGLPDARAALSWALGRIDKYHLTASELLDYEAAERIVLGKEVNHG